MAKKKKQEEVVKENNNILLENNIDTKTIKNDLEKYIDEKVNKVFVDELDKANRRLIREKTRKIWVKNLVIIILLIIIGFLVYLLYTNNYFDRFIKGDNNHITELEKKNNDNTEEEKEKAVEKPKEPTLDELKTKYANLLDNYYINSKSAYLKDYYNGELTTDLKNYLTLNTIDFSSLKKEEDYEIITLNEFKLAYTKLFNDDYEKNSFDYNGNKIRYISLMDAYMTSSILIKENSDISRAIIDIKVNDNDVIITTIEGLLKDGKLYNIITNQEIEEYKNDDLINYQKSLNKMIYHFKNNKLISLGK